MTAAAVRRPIGAFVTLGLLPALLTACAMRCLLPPVHTVTLGPAFIQSLARAGHDHPLPFAVGFFVLFQTLVRSNRAPSAAAVTSPRRPVALALSLCAAALAAVFVRTRIAEPSRVLSSSMLPGLAPNDDILVDKRARKTPPRRGEVVVFDARPGLHGPHDLVKRVVGLPGDRIRMNGGLPVINGWSVPTCDAGSFTRPSHPHGTLGHLFVEFLGDQTYLTVQRMTPSPFTGEYVVQPNEVFVLGDNRNQSSDSRLWNEGRGAGVPFSSIQGRVTRTLMRETRNGHADLSALLAPFDLDPRLPDMDTRALQEGIARCLAKRPEITQPPAASR